MSLKNVLLVAAGAAAVTVLVKRLLAEPDPRSAKQAKRDRKKIASSIDLGRLSKYSTVPKEIQSASQRAGAMTTLNLARAQHGASKKRSFGES